ncbi:hypothetical protein FNF27_06933 [Cafeteria roenbergensis]|uniref:Dynein heavy chain tail domain-containing protein n=2 Tax=Cafeteria roenbergensis TaxID=33653 RepID=A0A5A8DW96_CAFRO|nr:hypothetical protein FNF27_06933 [Cafeteria roenbergensis]
MRTGARRAPPEDLDAATPASAPDSKVAALIDQDDERVDRIVAVVAAAIGPVGAEPRWAAFSRSPEFEDALVSLITEPGVRSLFVFDAAGELGACNAASALMARLRAPLEAAAGGAAGTTSGAPAGSPRAGKPAEVPSVAFVWKTEHTALALDARGGLPLVSGSLISPSAVQAVVAHAPEQDDGSGLDRLHRRPVEAPSSARAEDDGSMRVGHASSRRPAGGGRPVTMAQAVPGTTMLLERVVVRWSRQIRAILQRQPEQLLSAALADGAEGAGDMPRSVTAALHAAAAAVAGAQIGGGPGRLGTQLTASSSAGRGGSYPASVAAGRALAATPTGGGAGDDSDDDEAAAAASELERRLLCPDDDLEHAAEQAAAAASLAADQEVAPGATAELQFWESRSRHLSDVVSQLLSGPRRRALLLLDARRSAYADSFAAVIAEANSARREANSNARLQSAFFDVKARSQLEIPGNPWRLRTSAVFARVQGLVDRCHDLLELARTSQHFASLETLFVGGPKGPALTASVRGITADFRAAVGALTASLDVVGAAGPRAARSAVSSAIADARAAEAAAQAAEAAAADAADAAAAAAASAASAASSAGPASIASGGQGSGPGAAAMAQGSGRRARRALAQSRRRAEEASRTSDAATLARVCLQAAAASTVMDVGVGGWDDALYAFRASVGALERRLAAVLAQAFDAQASLSDRLALLESFGPVLGRASVAAESNRRLLQLIQETHVDVREVTAIFAAGRADPPLPRNAPPVAGAVAWARGLAARAKQPVLRLRVLSPAVMAGEEAEPLRRDFAALSRALLDFETQRLGVTVPAEAASLHMRGTDIRSRSAQLELVADAVNDLRSLPLAPERPLLENRLRIVAMTLAAGFARHTWRDDHSDAAAVFIADASDAARAATAEMRAVLSVVQGTRTRLLRCALAGLWVAPARTHRPLDPASLGARLAGRWQLRFAAVAAAGQETQRGLQDLRNRLAISASAPEWQSFTHFVARVTEAGLVRVAARALAELLAALRNEPVVPAEAWLGSRFGEDGGAGSAGGEDDDLTALVGALYRGADGSGGGGGRGRGGLHAARDELAGFEDGGPGMGAAGAGGGAFGDGAFGQAGDLGAGGEAGANPLLELRVCLRESGRMLAAAQRAVGRRADCSDPRVADAIAGVGTTVGFSPPLDQAEEDDSRAGARMVWALAAGSGGLGNGGRDDGGDGGDDDDDDDDDDNDDDDDDGGGIGRGPADGRGAGGAGAYGILGEEEAFAGRRDAGGGAWENARQAFVRSQPAGRGPGGGGSGGGVVTAAELALSMLLPGQEPVTPDAAHAADEDELAGESHTAVGTAAVMAGRCTRQPA